MRFLMMGIILGIASQLHASIIYVALPSENAVLKIDTDIPSPQNTQRFTGTALTQVTGIAVNNQSRLFIAASALIHELDPNSGAVLQSVFGGDIRQMEFSPNGNLYVLSSGTGEIRGYDINSWSVTQTISIGSYASISDFVFDNLGNMFIAAPGVQKILKFDSIAQVVSDFASVGPAVSTLEIGNDGGLYVPTRDDLLRYNTTTGSFTTPISDYFAINDVSDIQRSGNEFIYANRSGVSPFEGLILCQLDSPDEPRDTLRVVGRFSTPAQQIVIMVPEISVFGMSSTMCFVFAGMVYRRQMEVRIWTK